MESIANQVLSALGFAFSEGERVTLDFQNGGVVVATYWNEEGEHPPRTARIAPEVFA
jgi:hypothetical protein